MSFYTSLSGLQGAQTQLSTISNNIANSETNGFKGSRVNFGDIMTTGKFLAPSHQVGSGTAITSIQQDFGQGTLQQTSSALDLAITGEGFFAVKPSLATTAVNYTRNGAFTVNSDRYVTDSNGAYLQVYPVDGSGTVVSSGLGSTQSLQLPLSSGDPQATGAVGLALDLPSSATIIPNDPKYTTANPYAFDRFDAATYNQSTNTTIYDAQGNAETMTTYYTKLTSPTSGTPTSTWAVHSFVGDQEIFPTGTTAPLTLTFNAAGKLTAPATATTYANFTPAAGGSQSVAVDYAGSTQVSGGFDVASATQDGFPTGQLQGVTVGTNGVVTASFSNGTTKALGSLVIASFTNSDGLKQDGNSTWSSTGASGDPILGQAGQLGLGEIQSGALESSNVDLTSQLVDLISAQRYFQSNSKAIETQSDLIEGIINIRS